MQLTRAADYALRVMIHLASQPEAAKLRLRDLAAAVDAPENFLAKVLQCLSRADLVLSRRGPDGGFELPVSGRRATVLDVIEAIEGPIALNVCLSEEGCERRDWCPAHLVWAEAQRAMVTILRGATIEHMASVGRQRKAALACEDESEALAKQQ